LQAGVGEVRRAARNTIFYFVAVGREGASVGSTAVQTGIGAARDRTVEVAAASTAKAVELASDHNVQVTAASAVGGAVVGGTGGAATGLLTGGALGAAVGIVPAIFTFGLSIPIGAALGGGCGLFAGTAVGSTTGAIAGGTLGYGLLTKEAAVEKEEDPKDTGTACPMSDATGGTSE